MKDPIHSRDVLRAHTKVLNAIEELRALVNGDRRLRLQATKLLLKFAKIELLFLRDLADDRMLYAARALEGLSACVFGSGKSDDATRTRVLRECGAKLLHAGLGPQEKFDIIAPTETSRLAVAVRSTVTRELQREGEQRDLGETVELGRDVHRARSLFPAPIKPQERVRRFQRAIRLLTRGLTDTDEEFATRVVVACAKAAGFKRPSALFQFEDKAIRRAQKQK